MDHDQPIAYRTPEAWSSGPVVGIGCGGILVQLSIAIGVIFVSVILCAIGGGFIGKIIAVLYPAYYPAMFAPASSQPGFDSSSVGIGLGVGQGAGVGVIVGLVLVISLAIANRRRSRPQV